MGCVFNFFVFLFFKLFEKNGILFFEFFFIENVVIKLIYYIYVIFIFIVDLFILICFYNMILGIKNELVFILFKICFKKVSLMYYFFFLFIYRVCFFLICINFVC